MQITQDTIQVKTFADTSEKEERGNQKKTLGIHIANKKRDQEGATI